MRETNAAPYNNFFNSSGEKKIAQKLFRILKEELTRFSQPKNNLDNIKFLNLQCKMLNVITDNFIFLMKSFDLFDQTDRITLHK